MSLVVRASLVPAALAVVLLATPARTRAQSPPAVTVQATAGWAGFIDETWVGRTAVGLGALIRVTDRTAIGPELVYLRGPAGAHDWTLTGQVAYDLLGSSGPKPRRVVPYLVAGGGYLRQTTRVGTGLYSSAEGTVSGGGGARIAIGDRWFVAPEFRAGLEPELRFVVHVGLRTGGRR